MVEVAEGVEHGLELMPEAGQRLVGWRGNMDWEHVSEVTRWDQC